MTALLVDHVAVQLALRSVLLTLPELPAGREWDNVGFQPTTGQPFIREQYSPSTSTLRGLTASGPIEETGEYYVNWYGVSGDGLTIARGVTKLLALYPPGKSIAATDGTIVRIRGDVAPRRGQLLQADPGWAVITATIPFRIIQ